MKVVSTALAKRQFRGTVRYIQREFGHRSAERFVQKVKETRTLLARNPRLGPVDPLLDDPRWEYRSVVIARQNKMVYRITDDRIEIVVFWDVRREPKELAKGIEN